MINTISSSELARLSAESSIPQVPVAEVQGLVRLHSGEVMAHLRENEHQQALPYEEAKLSDAWRQAQCAFEDFDFLDDATAWEAKQCSGPDRYTFLYRTLPDNPEYIALLQTVEPTDEEIVDSLHLDRSCVFQVVGGGRLQLSTLYDSSEGECQIADTHLSPRGPAKGLALPPENISVRGRAKGAKTFLKSLVTSRTVTEGPRLKEGEFHDLSKVEKKQLLEQFKFFLMPVPFDNRPEPTVEFMQ